MVEWNCQNCQWEIISQVRGNFCLECEWKRLVEEIEINPETIQSFMEKYWLVSFDFKVGEYFDIINIEAKNTKNLTSLQYCPDGLTTGYHPRTKKNTKKDFFGKEIYNEYSAFLEKLFHFAKEQKIKRIRGKWKKEISDKLVSFKVDSVIIEKKTAQELEKEEL
ncbi:MAG: hypothetical protein I3270_01450 [Candidatus Moeniiplasma glomeromycotorum]|nr:hypothetical protein [Candidatus Moeniiplasma glomeromycotorum]MCE8162374.1 hypothetical protein [Candidatus Moeniiplasma glomeromycotorum]MCE8166298.1 hypothetical protein [Candidatus Moeniiplasma glomeromycotorum]MCE8166780.1 hypothetical protein [Candidatus Moeniiplasma glomeromycotorum]